MRFEFDPDKSHLLRKNPNRGIGFEEAARMFERTHYQDQRSDLPEQYRAIGWVGDKLYSLIFEVREDDDGEFYHLVTLGRPRERRRCSMKKTSKAPSAKAIAKLADSGKSVSRFFTNKGKMIKPSEITKSIQRVNVDFAPGMLAELDREAVELNISRQAVIKSLLRNALDQRRMATAK